MEEGWEEKQIGTSTIAIDMESFLQDDFDGGMNSFLPDYALAPNEYPEAYNLRFRERSAQAIKSALEDTTAPRGIKRGIYGFNDFIFLACNGRIYYKNLFLNGPWTIIPGLFLSANERVYMQDVPATPETYPRYAIADNITGSESNTSIQIKQESAFISSGVTSGLVVQDGVSQPYFIYFVASVPFARRTNTYAQWTKQNREYVPIGRQMCFTNGKLFVVSSDGSAVYHSVTVRPLDFVIEVTATGEKGGDATRTSFSPTANRITAIKPLNNGNLFIGTFFTCYSLEFDYSRTLFGEPTMLHSAPISVGIINQFSFVDILGDYVAIDLDGLRSFNAVIQDSNEGRNSIFSLNLASFLSGIRQDASIACAAVFDNYAFFSLKTRIGDAIAVYDIQKKKWICFDRYGIGQVLQFATATTDVDPVLWCITNNRVYKLFHGEDYLEARIDTKTLKDRDNKHGIMVNAVRPFFTDVFLDSPVSVSLLIDDEVGVTTEQTLEGASGAILYPAEYPVAFRNGRVVMPRHFNFKKKAREGAKVGCSIVWSTGIKLSSIYMEGEMVTHPTPVNQRVEAYAS